MDAETVRDLIARGEGQEVEFKSSFADSRAIITTLAGFANARGGTLIVGVSDQAAVVGVKLGERTLDRFANKLPQRTEPQLPAEIYPVDLAGRPIVAITVSPSSSGTIMAFGEHYHRVGGTTQKVRPAAKPIRVLGQEHPAGTSLYDLLPDPIAEFRPHNKHLRELEKMREAIERIERHV